MPAVAAGAVGIRCWAAKCQCPDENDYGSDANLDHVPSGGRQLTRMDGLPGGRCPGQADTLASLTGYPPPGYCRLASRPAEGIEGSA